MKVGVKSSPNQITGLGKRSAQSTRAAAEDNSEGSMEAKLLQLLRENDKLKNQLSESQGEVQRLKEVIDCQQDQKKSKASDDDNKSQSRYWTEEEHQKFLDALQTLGPKDVKAIASFVGTRSATQVRTHAQKYFLKLARMKRSAEDVVQGGTMDNTWWLESSREASGRSASRDSPSNAGRGNRSSSSSGFGAMELDSMRLLADLVASSASSETVDAASEKPYGLHREPHRRTDHRSQHFNAAASTNGSFFLPDGGGARRGAGAGSGSGGSSSSDSGSRSSGGASMTGSSGGVSLSAMSAPHHASHVHREWRGIIRNASGREGGGGEEEGRGGARSPSNEESGPTDGSSTHGNGTSHGGSGADSGGSSHRSSCARGDNHSSDGSRSSNHSSGSWTPDDLNSNPADPAGSGGASPLAGAGVGGRAERCWAQAGGEGKERGAAREEGGSWRPGPLSIRSLLA